MALSLRRNVPAIEKRLAFVMIQAGMYVSQLMYVGIDEAMARGQVARRTNSQQSQSSPARVRFTDALVNLGECIANVRESVVLIFQSTLQIFIGQGRELL